MKLIGSLSSPYVRKVRNVMAEKKLDYQFVEEDVWTSDAILASNPLGKVPCLVMEGGEAVFDSRVIVEYLDARSPLARLIPESNRERTEVRTWEALDAIATGLGAKPWCTGIHMTLADVAVGCALGYLDFRFPQLGWRNDRANVARLADKLNARKTFI